MQPVDLHRRAAVPSPLCCPPCFPLKATLRREQAAAGAVVLWMGLMYCFWRMGTYLPGVPAPVEGIFRMKQVSREACTDPPARAAEQRAA